MGKGLVRKYNFTSVIEIPYDMNCWIANSLWRELLNSKTGQFHKKQTLATEIFFRYLKSKTTAQV